MCLQAQPERLAFHITEHKVFVPPRYVNTTPNVNTVCSSDASDDLIQTKLLLIPNLTNKFDAAVNIDNKSYYFENPIKNNHCAT